ncbi:MAG: UTP--glucose-1-phosphate uridylyltransferase [Desulfomonilaceae bacterium]
MKLDGMEERIKRKMGSRGIHPAAIENFLEMVDQIGDEHSAYVSVDRVSTPDTGLLLNPPDPTSLAKLAARGRSLLTQTAVIKLNGGRSTTMGGLVPKGVLTAKNGRSYLEIIIGQIAAIRRDWGIQMPLVLMDSFFTHGPTMEIVARLGLPVLTFIQNQIPRLVQETLAPLESGTDEDWAPPGHGDVYESLQRTGLLDRLRENGCRWAFISNLDNLAASVEPWILGLMEAEGIEFLLEVTARTTVDRKGGTLVVGNGRLDLLEIAQVAPEDRESFMDTNRFRVFNTNNVWVDLDALSTALKEKSLRLPLIQNHKTIAGQKIIQLETAMGAAIGSFRRARGLQVGRDRFFPTKKVADLFLLQSDVCVLDSMDKLQKNPLRPSSLPLRPTVFFGPEFLNSPLELFERFEDPSSVSLVNARSLAVSGPIFFERDVRIEGKVVINAPQGEIYRISKGTVLRTGKYP